MKLFFLIQISGLHEFEALKNPEINDFRWRARVLCESIQELRIDKSWIEKVNYQYPLRVEKDSLIPFYLQNYLKQDEIVLELRFETSKVILKKRFYSNLITIAYPFGRCHIVFVLIALVIVIKLSIKPSKDLIIIKQIRVSFF